MRALRSFGIPLVAFALPFGFLMGLVGDPLMGPPRSGLAVGLIAGVSGGGLFALIVGTMDLVSNRDAPPGRSTGPRQSVTVPVRPGWDLPGRVQGALQGLPATLLVADVPAGRYAARTRLSWRSWGEYVGVQLAGHREAPSAVVTSRPVLRTTLFDYGRGRRNVDQIVAALRH